MGLLYKPSDITSRLFSRLGQPHPPGLVLLFAIINEPVSTTSSIEKNLAENSTRGAVVIPFTSAQQEGGPYGIVDDDEGQTYKWSWNSATKANVKAYFTLAENTGMITLKTSQCLESGLVAQPCLDFYADDTSDYYCYWPDRCIEDKDGDVRSDPKYNQKKYELIIDIEDG